MSSAEVTLPAEIDEKWLAGLVPAPAGSASWAIQKVVGSKRETTPSWPSGPRPLTVRPSAPALSTA